MHSALNEGARISLGTDAHHPWQLAFMDFALAAALLAGYQRDRIVNFMPIQDLTGPPEFKATETNDWPTNGPADESYKQPEII